jgi:hypothetical protein
VITRAVPAIALPTTGDASAFQRQYDDELRTGEHTPLTAVDSHYVAEGQVLRLGLKGRLPVKDPTGDPVAIFALRDGAFQCDRGCAGAPTTIETRSTFPFGPLTLIASPQSGPGRVILHDPQAESRTRFDGLPWFPLSDSAIVAAGVERAEGNESARLTTSRGLTKDLPVFGTFFFDFGTSRVHLVGYSMGAHNGVESVLIPFTDETTGESTYPVGRYLNVDVPATADAVALDFNRATNPLCAYSPHYNCPIPPAGNQLQAAVEAGERYQAH